MRTRRLTAALLAATTALALGACGNKDEDGIISQAETEGIYVDVSEVKYQVQMSRILNPGNAEDATYLEGVLPGVRELEEGETWFGVWLRAENESREPQPKAERFHIKDTLGNEYEPVLQPDNILTWMEQPDVVGPTGTQNDLIPVRGSTASQTSIQGSLLLFKLTYEGLENRPLELEIENPRDPESVATVNLDV